MEPVAVTAKSINLVREIQRSAERLVVDRTSVRVPHRPGRGEVLDRVLALLFKILWQYVTPKQSRRKPECVRSRGESEIDCRCSPRCHVRLNSIRLPEVETAP